jgi:hypothetical protein
LTEAETLRINFSPFETFIKQKSQSVYDWDLIFVGPLGLEPRLFYTKNRRVASYTMGQYQNLRAFALLSRNVAVVLGGANLIQTLFSTRNF